MSHSRVGKEKKSWIASGGLEQQIVIPDRGSGQSFPRAQDGPRCVPEFLKQ
jgi:hypothetical protein